MTTPFDQLSGLALLYIWDNIRNGDSLAYSCVGFEVKAEVQAALERKINDGKLCVDKSVLGERMR